MQIDVKLKLKFQKLKKERLTEVTYAIQAEKSVIIYTGKKIISFWIVHFFSTVP